MANLAYRVAKTISGNSPFAHVFEAGGTIVAGTFVVVGDTGTVTALADDGDNVTGMAAHAAVSGDDVLVYLGVADTIFSAAVGTGTYAAETIGEIVDYNVAGIDFDSSTDDIFMVLGLDTTDDARVLVTCVQAEGMAFPGAGTTTTD